MPEAAAGSLGLVIGRFQPFHRGHDVICREALAQCERLLVVLGSAGQARSIRNPFTDAEREALIRAALADIAPERLLFAPVPDVFYNEEVWLRAVREAVEPHAGDDRVVLYGHNKDSSSYYLALFPQWDYRELPNYQGLSATPLRDALLAAGPAQAAGQLQQLADRFPASEMAQLVALLQAADFAELCADYALIERYREAWSRAPYPPIFVTVDALVECAGQVLLIRRGQRPGRGLLALPGGFLDPDERLEAGARRELREETGLDLAAHPHQLIASRPYDAPERSARGRFVTHLFHYRLQLDTPPVVQGADDAAAAGWFRREQFSPEQLFEDHYCILQHALNWY